MDRYFPFLDPKDRDDNDIWDLVGNDPLIISLGDLLDKASDYSSMFGFDLDYDITNNVYFYTLKSIRSLEKFLYDRFANPRPIKIIDEKMPEDDPNWDEPGKGSYHYSPSLGDDVQ